MCLKDAKNGRTSRIFWNDPSPFGRIRQTQSEYDEIFQRLEQSSRGPMILLRDAVSSEANMLALHEKVDKACERMTLKVNIISFSEQKGCSIFSSYVTDIYKIEILDI